MLPKERRKIINEILDYSAIVRNNVVALGDISYFKSFSYCDKQ